MKVVMGGDGLLLGSGAAPWGVAPEAGGGGSPWVGGRSRGAPGSALLGSYMLPHPYSGQFFSSWYWVSKTVFQRGV